MTPAWCAALPGGVRLAVHIIPNAKRTEVVGLHGDALKIRLQAQPIEGRANEALVRFVAEALGLPRTAVVITHGHTAKRKVVEAKGDVDPQRARAALAPEGGWTGGP